MLREPFTVFVGRNLPELLQPDPEFLRIAAVGKRELRDQLLAEVAARAFGEQRVFGAQLHAAGEAVFGFTGFADAHVAGGDARHRTIAVIENFGCGKARIDFDAEPFGFGGQPTADVAERDDEITVIAHQRRHHEIRQSQRATFRQIVEVVVDDRGLDRRILGAPVRQQFVEADRIDHRAGEDVRADLGPLLHDHHGDVGIDLLEPDGGGEAGGAGTDDNNIEFHRLAGG